MEANITTAQDMVEATKLPGPALPKIRYGRIGHIYEVSCGTLDEDNKFETFHRWTHTPERKSWALSYVGDSWPRKFRVCLTDTDQGDLIGSECMDFHESNIQGLIFEESKSLHSQVIYFIVNRPPQFYRRNEEPLSQAFCSTSVSNDSTGSTNGSWTKEGESGAVYCRITHPSSMHELKGSDVNVCDVPWIIQYSRVFKVEYKKSQDFNFQSYEPRVRDEQKKTLFAFTHPGIKDSGRTVCDIIETIRRNIKLIPKAFPPYHSHSCQLAIIKLLYNCNVPATSVEATSLIHSLLKVNTPKSTCTCRLYTMALNKISRDMEKSHIRALRRLHAELPQDAPKLPKSPLGKLAKPVEALSEMLESDYFTKEKERRQWPQICPHGIFEVIIYPSHIELEGPKDPPSNSITDQYGRIIDNFIRVRFVDNDKKTLKTNMGIDLEEIIERRVIPILSDDNQLLSLIHQRFEFLGYSMSSLKHKKAIWFFRPQEEEVLNAKIIRDRIGVWDARKGNKKLAHHPSKWGARISLAFTESIPVAVLSQDEWKFREDYPDDEEFPNTDGCGLITPALCETINAALAPFGYARSRAFQIRFGGAKGVVYAGERSLLRHQGFQYKMLLRNSQLKFQAPECRKLDLRIASTTGDSHQSLFFPSALKAFEDSGADTTKIEDIYTKSYKNLRRTSTEGLDLLEQIFRIPAHGRKPNVKAKYSLLALAVRLNHIGISPEQYQNTFLAVYLAKIAERAYKRDLFKLPIPGSYCLLGLTDDYQILQPNEVFVHFQEKTIEGEVLVYRDPIIHIGDIQIAKAIGRGVLRRRLEKSGLGLDDIGSRMNALTIMDNVIFFSQKDRPPLPNRLSGGDLDGDRFEVLTKDCGFWTTNYSTSAPDSYTNDESGPLSQPGHDLKSFDISQLTGFIGHFIKNHCFEDLQDILMCLADQREGGMKHDDVKALAKWLSKAVDYAKSGEVVDLTKDVLQDPRFKVLEKPDFLCALNGKALYDPKAKYHESSSVLGKIYREHIHMKYTLPRRLDNLTLHERVFNRNNCLLSNSQISRKLRIKLDDDIGRIVLDEVAYYRQYCQEQQIENGAQTIQHLFPESSESEHLLYEVSEADLFLQDQPDDFPNNFVQNLVGRTLECLSRYSILTVTFDSSFTPRARLGRSYQMEDVQASYEYCLFQAWCIAISESELAWAQPGQGYAFICLYALYCWALPLEED